jgi:hypothetical protein
LLNTFLIYKKNTDLVEIHGIPHDTSGHNEYAKKLDVLAVCLNKIINGSTADEENSDKKKGAKGNITASVGQGVDNKSDNVKIIQKLLNKNGTSLTVDGDCGPLTIAAIREFQSRMGIKNPDGLVSRKNHGQV